MLKPDAATGDMDDRLAVRSQQRAGLAVEIGESVDGIGIEVAWAKANQL